MNLEVKKKVLILGGSTFMGKSLVELLSSQHEQYEVHYVNRGKKYWNNEITKIKNIHFTYGNRDETQDYTKVLRYLSSKLGINSDSKWEAVIDFCAFYAKHSQGVYDALANLTKIYIVISTDSIYDVCDKSIRLKGQLITEDMDVRPEDDKLYQQYKEEEDYGHDKLKCEEFLKFLKNKEDFPFICLRLPDVIGPYDDTGRFWAYIKWIQCRESYPLEDDFFSNTQELSLVYSLDVCNIIKDMIDRGFYKNQQIVNQSYNICFDEVINLRDLIQKIVQLMGIDNMDFKHQQKAKKFYPSVECGPISNKKSKSLLGVTMTPLDVALMETIQFFVNIKVNQYNTEEDKARRKLDKKFTLDQSK